MSKNPKLELLALLEEKARRMKARAPIWAPKVENKPQTMAFNSDADVIGYGGAAGGGKTSTAVGLALLKHERVLVVRETFPELDGVIKAFTETCGDDARYHKTEHTLTPMPALRNRGASAKSVRFGYLQRSDDINRYQGHEYDLIAFEEVVNMDEKIVRTVSAWNRTATPGQKCQIYMTWNPPSSPKGAWIIQFFAPWINENHPMYPTPSGTVLHVAMFPEGEYFSTEPTIYTHNPTTGAELRDPQPTKSRVFFRATYKDNPCLPADYASTLMGLTEAERNRLMYGEMTSFLVDGASQIIRQSHYEAAQTRWRYQVEQADPRNYPPSVISLDLAEGGTDETVITPIYHGGFVGEQHSIPGSFVNSGKDNVAELVKFMWETWQVTPSDSRDKQGHRTIIAWDGIGTAGGSFGAALEAEYPDAETYCFIGSHAPGVRGVFGGDSYPISARTGMPIASGNGSFSNKITAAWVRLGQMLEHKAFSICLPPSVALRSELTSRRIAKQVANDIGKGSKISIESKDEFRKRLGRSPDHADSVVMGLFVLDQQSMLE